ncbi:rhizopuspepsin 1 precursor [Radiomyces spectabilis]|uniref:rhizopuspepsin 1 precursor n=1 Tax=Radiomyces spectabilis TaxID=64574 RepID=UPI00221E991F|nr:rhizopuspepsin 1 precursor [Radiomyces spectabilis]KAI8381086.1 rhizopuspepsin 1 precursor [Radiomyces spectabilis]
MKLSFCVAALIAAVQFSSAAPMQDTESLKFPLVRNPHYKQNATASVLRVQAKYSKYLGGISAMSSGTTSVPMTDYHTDVEYFGTVEVGTPPQKLLLNFDTGSSDLWFASTLCHNCASKQTKFDPNKSETYKKDGRKWSISYGDGSKASGICGKDTVTLGDLTIKDQIIELATTESDTFQTDPVDGLLGLGFNSITTVRGVKTPMDNLISQKLISKPIFGVYLGKHTEKGGGEFRFGEYDQNRFTGDLHTVKVDNSNGYWGIKIDSATVGTKKIAGFDAIVDTGTTLLLFTDKVAKTVAAAYKAKDNGDGTFMISCNTSSLKPLSLTLGGKAFLVPSDSLVFSKQGSQCVAGFGYAGLPFAILGDTFIKNNYIVFNHAVPEIQVAALK